MSKRWTWIPFNHDGTGPTLMRELRDSDGQPVLDHGDGWIEVGPEDAAMIAALPQLLAALRAVTPIAKEYFQFERGRVEQALHTPEAPAIINAENLLMRFPEVK
jgi:hypothetical protein